MYILSITIAIKSCQSLKSKTCLKSIGFSKENIYSVERLKKIIIVACKQTNRKNT